MKKEKKKKEVISFSWSASHHR